MMFNFGFVRTFSALWLAQHENDIFAIVTFEQIDQHSMLYLSTAFSSVFYDSVHSDSAVYLLLLVLGRAYSIWYILRNKKKIWKITILIPLQKLTTDTYKCMYNPYPIQNKIHSGCTLYNRVRILWESLNFPCSKAKHTKLMSFQFPDPESACVYHEDCFWLTEFLTNAYELQTHTHAQQLTSTCVQSLRERIDFETKWSSTQMYVWALRTQAQRSGVVGRWRTKT